MSFLHLNVVNCYRLSMKSWLETASSMEDGSLPCMLAEGREALLPITGRENLAPRKRYTNQ